MGRLDQKSERPTEFSSLAPCLFSLGYEGKSLDQYIAELKTHEIVFVCDVRNNPWSRKPGFSKKVFQEGLLNAGIFYEHFPQLGIPSNLRRSTSAHGAEKLFELYREEMLPKQSAALDKIVALMHIYRRVALTCFEADPGACHRTLVVNALVHLPGWKYPHQELDELPSSRNQISLID